MAHCYDDHLDRLAWHPLPDDADAMDEAWGESGWTEMNDTPTEDENMDDWVYFPEYRAVMAPTGSVCEVCECAEAEHRGHLIAAAPALLAACEKAFAVFDGIGSVAPLGDWYVKECRTAVDMLRAALALARGES